jgi:hypothetical protein
MFTQFSAAVHKRFLEMSKGELFVVDVEHIFEKYLSFYPAGSDPIYKTRTEHDCQCCKQFIRRVGVLVSIIDGEMLTVWGGHTLPAPYDTVSERMDALIKGSSVKSVFRTKERRYSVEHNYDKEMVKYNHFYAEIADRHYTTSPEEKIGEQDAVAQVLRRGLETIQREHLDTVLDLIDSNGLYRGEEHRPAVVGFRDLLNKYNGNPLFIWENLTNRNSRFRNTVIGTLLTDLAEGKDIDVAVKAFETKVAPANYKRTTSIITQKMVEQAIETLNALGLGGAIYRRYAKLSDVSVNDVLFVDNAAKGKMKDGVAALLESSIKRNTPDLKNASPITDVAFLEVLKGAKSVDVFVENRHSGNFLSLTGSDGPERLFKWSNNFAWSYDGDVTDSVKQRVKAAGGNINALLRVSLSWFNFDDLDLHADGPFGHIYFGNKAGILDVDMNACTGTTRNPVENLAFNSLPSGTWRIYVNQFHRRETIDFGFAIEVEFGGVIHQYSYPKAVKNREDVPCFDLIVKGGALIDIKSSLVGGSFSQEKWGIKTETLVPVTSIMHSPNHWNGQAAGARHLIFALKGCKNPDPVRGIYNEFLRSDLEKHRKVFEVLGSKTKCQPTEDQISGVGFTSARGDSVTVVVDGRRSYNVSF